MTNTIQCKLCGKTSQQDEDFLDLCVSVSSSRTLEDSLERIFLESEVLDTSNRYRCDVYGELTDAVKRTRLRHLPPILTVSLLRFNYDPVKKERYKETGQFEFPLFLDMSRFFDPGPDKRPCCGEPGTGDCIMNGLDFGDNQGTACMDDSFHIYELFSVVVHRGGAYGGHYHALIRDLEDRGIWSAPERIQPSTADSSPRVPCSKPPGPANTITEVDLTSPRSVITSILLESGGGMSIGDLSGRISSLTGESWRKKYKQRHGSLVKFLTDNCDVFVYNPAEDWISLLPPDFGRLSPISDRLQQSKPEEDGKETKEDGILPEVNGATGTSAESKVEVVGVDRNTAEVNGIGSRSSISGGDPATAVGRKKRNRESRRVELDVSCPRSVIVSILCEAGCAAGLSVTELCSKIAEVTGDSWRKRYKPKWGSLVKFLGDNSDVFVHDVGGSWVSLRAQPPADNSRESEMAEKLQIHGSSDSGTSLQRPDTAEVNGKISNGSLERSEAPEDIGDRSASHVIRHPGSSSTVAETRSRSRRNRKKKSKTKSAAHESTSETVQEIEEVGNKLTSVSNENSTPSPGQCWFDFNDTAVHPVHAKDIGRHFAGKECAYMLFYRAVPATTGNCPAPKRGVEIPDWLISEIAAENFRLERQRAEYEESVNMVKVEIHFGRSYECREGVLRPCLGACYYMECTVDLRQTAAHLLEQVHELGGELAERCRTIHTAKSLPSGGLHLYRDVTADPASRLKSSGIAQSTKLFVWNGREVDGATISVGYESEPITLRFQSDAASSETHTVTVAKNTTMFALRAVIAKRFGLSSHDKVSLYRTKDNGMKSEPLAGVDLNKAISDLGLCAKDPIIVSHPELPPSVPKSPQSCRNGVATSCSDPLPKQTTVYCENHVGSDVVTVEVEVDSAASVEELKVLIMTSADIAIELVAEVRLRVRLDDLGGVGPPLYEGVDLAAARLSDGVTLVLEYGKAPPVDEIWLTVSVTASSELELTVNHAMEIHQLLHEVLLTGQVSDAGDGWHLCRSDWIGDTGAALSDPNQTVGDVGLNHGDHLFLRPGCPPPPGFLKLFVHLESSPARPCWWDPIIRMAARISPDPIGSVVVSKTSTLAELKKEIMASLLVDHEIPSPRFIRLRILTPSLRPTAVLRDHAQTLARLKVATGCALGVEVLPEEEDLSPDQTVLTVRRRLPGERSYGDWTQEVVWDTSNGASVSSLRHVVAETIGEVESGISLAKHIPDKFRWIVIPHSDDAFHPADRGSVGGVGGGRKKRKRKAKNGGKSGGSDICDLKSAPFNLEDGDVIGVKVIDEAGGQDSDFDSVEDDIGRETLKSQHVATAPDVSRKSEVTPVTAPRVETAIKIHVDNFR